MSDRPDISMSANVHNPAFKNVKKLDETGSYYITLGSQNNKYDGVYLYFNDAEELREFAASLYLDTVDLIRDSAAA